MNDQPDLFHPEPAPDHESSLRRMMADATGQPYAALRSLTEAKQVVDGVVILEGDDGGQIYAVVAAADVQCSEETLQGLLRDLDAQEWNDPSMAHVIYERRTVGDTVAGGMGGGTVRAGVWVHARLRHLEGSIAAVLHGERERI
jgi:hypothetical protein